ncbi:MAG: hypothetical protein QNK37_08470 [Acidobacteriota bacterium]|nr:hypothetical protein [Acidobacteriota bacterium]
MKTIGTVFLAMIALSPLPATDPEVAKLIEKALKTARVSPMMVDLTMTMGNNDKVNNMSMSLSGVMLYKDETHLRMDMSIDITMYNQTINSKMLMVADGKDYWVENKLMNQPVPQVLRADVQKIKELKAGMNMESFQPDSILEALKTQDIRITESKDGMVTLEGTATREFIEKLDPEGKQGGGLSDMAGNKVRAVIHRENTFPLSITVFDGDAPFMTVTLANLRQPSAAEIAEKLKYTPPKGVPVMDAGDMLKQ